MKTEHQDQLEASNCKILIILASGSISGIIFKDVKKKTWVTAREDIENM